jgi:carbon-monoxide dehydrogenase iron sulfur subunit
MRKKIIDPEKCTGCKNCELACVVVHSPDESLLRAYRDGAGAAIRSRCQVALTDDGRRVSLHCQHCADPQCLRACMSGALSRDENGYVVCDSDVCVGCYMCVMSCPNGAARPVTGGKRRLIKCDGCGAREEMACAAACPTGALSVEEADITGDMVEYISHPDREEARG